jgi:hypothetical protein
MGVRLVSQNSDISGGEKAKVELFDEARWGLNPEVILQKRYVSIVDFDLPEDDTITRLENLLHGHEADVLFRHVTVSMSPKIEVFSEKIEAGSIQRIISNEILCPLIVVADSAQILFFKEDGCDYHIIAGKREAVEQVIGCSVEEAHAIYVIRLENLRPPAKLNFHALENKFFKLSE